MWISRKVDEKEFKGYKRGFLRKVIFEFLPALSYEQIVLVTAYIVRLAEENE